MNPQEAIRFGELIDLDFSNESFHVLHHFGDEATIRVSGNGVPRASSVKIATSVMREKTLLTRREFLT